MCDHRKEKGELTSAVEPLNEGNSTIVYYTSKDDNEYINVRAKCYEKYRREHFKPDGIHSFNEAATKLVCIPNKGILITTRDHKFHFHPYPDSKVPKMELHFIKPIFSLVDLTETG